MFFFFFNFKRAKARCVGYFILLCYFTTLSPLSAAKDLITSMIQVMNKLCLRQK